MGDSVSAMCKGPYSQKSTALFDLASVGATVQVVFATASKSAALLVWPWPAALQPQAGTKIKVLGGGGVGEATLF